MCRKLIIVMTLQLFCLTASAWTSAGHRVVADIAYDYLTPKAKNAVDRLTFVPGEHYSGRSRFRYISSWADVIRARGDNRFSTWHYIDLPDTVDGTVSHQPHIKNAVWAINKSTKMLQSGSDDNQKKTYLKLLIHIVGDVHQPLHAINRFSKRYPHGDLGGNRYLINSRYAQNLHQYWDKGVGLFKLYEQRYPLRRGNVHKLATDIEQKFPESSFGAKYVSRTPDYWAYESRALAKHYAYSLPERTTPSREYRIQGQKVVERRLALAGYRLAHLLNRVYG